MNSFLLREAGILRDLGVTLLISTGGSLITELLVAPYLLSLPLDEWTRHGVRRSPKKSQCSVVTSKLSLLEMASGNSYSNRGVNKRTFH